MYQCDLVCLCVCGWVGVEERDVFVRKRETCEISRWRAFVKMTPLISVAAVVITCIVLFIKYKRQKSISRGSSTTSDPPGL